MREDCCKIVSRCHADTVQRLLGNVPRTRLDLNRAETKTSLP